MNGKAPLLIPGIPNRVVSDQNSCGIFQGLDIFGWQDPEGILAAPVPGHIARRNYQKKIAGDDVEREKLERQLQLEKERRREAREVCFILNLKCWISLLNGHHHSQHTHKIENLDAN